MAATPYAYPVTDMFQARVVTGPDFEPELFESQLYVDFDRVRGEKFRREIQFTLNIQPATQTLAAVTNDYVKAIFSGHRGCGKTTELRRLHHELNNPARYFSIMVELEKETEYGALQPEDIFVWLILILVRELHQRQIPVNTSAFEELGRQLLADEEIEKELKQTFGTELSTQAEGGFSFFGLAKLATAAKAVFAGENVTSTKIRQAVRRNLLDIIRRLNRAMADARHAIAAHDQGRDLLFVVDGSEKIGYEVYEYLFIKNPNLLRELDVNMVIAVPIRSFYDIETTIGSNFANLFLLPMIRLDGPDSQANRCFKLVVERRIHVPTFFEPGVLDECVRVSGGCMRQLLVIVNTVIRKALGERASLGIAREAIEELGRRMSDLLSKEHLEVLKEGAAALTPGDARVRIMLHQLVLLKYNGHLKLNPLLEGFVTLPA